MKNKAKWLLTLFTVLCYSKLGFSQHIPKERKWSDILTIDNSLWIESDKNIEFSKQEDIDFLHPYNLPDADGEALALFRTNNTPLNTSFSILQTTSLDKSLKALKGRMKFSGSDIDKTNDTLTVTAFYSKIKDVALISNLNKGLIPNHASVVSISEPLAQFESFRIDLPESGNDEERKYLIIQLILKSGSDDSYYYGSSNAVIDNLHFTENRNN